MKNYLVTLMIACALTISVVIINNQNSCQRTCEPDSDRCETAKKRCLMNDFLSPCRAECAAGPKENLKRIRLKYEN